MSFFLHYYCHCGRNQSIANADIYFDSSLFRLQSAITRASAAAAASATTGGGGLNSTVLALLKWIDNWDSESSSSSSCSSSSNGTSISNSGIKMHLRTDSQDAWVFQPPISQYVLQKSDFLLGMPRCDNRIAQVFHEAGYNVVGAALLVQAIEIQATVRPTEGTGSGALYGMKKAVFGKTRDVLLSDRFDFFL